jgi:hypothetical protein
VEKALEDEEAEVEGEEKDLRDVREQGGESSRRRREGDGSSLESRSERREGSEDEKRPAALSKRQELLSECQRGNK